MTKSSKASVISSKTLNDSSEANALLGNYPIAPSVFSDIEDILASFRKEDFSNLNLRKRFRRINEVLYNLIRSAPKESFLLSPVIDYFSRLNQEGFLNVPLTLAAFEFWLINFSGLSIEEIYLTRAKIAGKFIPRSDYQCFFPIGMDRIFAGTHFVAAHLSPDIDTMIASFWGWMDAFAAGVGTGLHLWCLPGGPPDAPVTSIFREMFGQGSFDCLARTAQTLTLTAMDLLNQQYLTKERGETLISTLDYGSGKAIILIDEQGQYLGDWRSTDAEIVRQIIILFKSCLRWFENNLHTKLISLFAKNNLTTADLPAFNASLFDIAIKDCEPALEFNQKQLTDLHNFFLKILGIPDGLNGTFRDLNEALNRLSVVELLQFQQAVEALKTSGIFDETGKLRQERLPQIFDELERLIKQLDQAIQQTRNYVERLDVVVSIKHKVLELPLLYITLRSEVEEIRFKMQNYDFLTVVIPEQDNSLYPVGIVRASDLRKAILGTVTLRDFCNLDEVKMASYLEVISVVDHHKSSLKTTSVPLALIGDAQSCNVLIAEQAFLINDRYSLGGMTKEAIERQIEEHLRQPISSSSEMRVLQRLLHKRMAAQSQQPFYIHPEREFKEYLCFLQAILDDTDLLTKVSNRDVECVAQLVNRMKSILSGQEVEIINLDDIPRNQLFAKTAAKRILKNPDVYSLYKKVYSFREMEVESNLELCLQGFPSNIFLDTKEQNGCARVGQTKLFASNFPFLIQHMKDVRRIWLDKAQEVHRDRNEIDLHIHMISTIASAEEVYTNQIGPYDHQDELWIWIPSTQQAYDHLIAFLAGFQSVIQGLKDTMSVEFTGPNCSEFERIFARNFAPIPMKTGENFSNGLPLAILRFQAGALNSRKSMITPFIPRLIP